LLGAALFTVTLALGLVTRRPARAKCAFVFAELELESVTVDGLPAPAAPYARHEVAVWGLPEAVRLTVRPPAFQGFYEEIYRASAAGR
jgi:hypothetical protein